MEVWDTLVFFYIYKGLVIFFFLEGGSIFLFVGEWGGQKMNILLAR